MFQVLDRRYNFIKNSLLEYLGSEVVLGDENDWKKNVTEAFVSECLNQMTNNTMPGIRCNPDARKFGVCYWGKMFGACPADLRSETCRF